MFYEEAGVPSSRKSGFVPTRGPEGIRPAPLGGALGGQTSPLRGPLLPFRVRAGQGAGPGALGDKGPPGRVTRPSAPEQRDELPRPGREPLPITAKGQHPRSGNPLPPRTSMRSLADHAGGSSPQQPCPYNPPKVVGWDLLTGNEGRAWFPAAKARRSQAPRVLLIDPWGGRMAAGVGPVTILPQARRDGQAPGCR